MAIADLRREYTLGEIRRKDLQPDPLDQFRIWFKDAAGTRAGGRFRKFLVGFYKSVMLLTGAQPPDVSAVALATADKAGKPSVRMVLLKGLDQRGFIFFTNYDSRKGMELAENPQAALVFYWAELERQVCVAGGIEKISTEESNTYFQSRPWGSRLATWVSRQSKTVQNREELEKKWSELEASHKQKNIERPPYWGGYVLVPQRIEFWQGGANRLHDRLQYTRQTDNQWIIERLSP